MIRLFKHYVPYALLLLGAIDFLLLGVAGEAAWRLRATQAGIHVGSLAARADWLLSFAILVSTAMIGVGVYRSEALRSPRQAAARLFVAFLLAVAGLALLDYILGGGNFWRSHLALASLVGFALLMLNRLLLGGLLGTAVFRRRVVVLGAGQRADRLRRLAERPDAGFSLVGFVKMTDQEPVIAGAVHRDSITDLARFVEELRAGEVVLAIEERRNSLPLADLLRVKTAGVYVNDYSSFLERETGRVDLDTLNPSWLIFSDGFSSGRALSGAVKRLCDIAASLVLLVLTAPLIALFALLVKLDSKGPAFFRQTRVGLFGESFELIKLRSMRTDAEAAGAQFAQADDPRVTRLGKFIRKVRIDELPQAWSVLKGEMSFVGPRPERPEFVSQLEEHLPYYAERHMVKPGITGWAQINYPYGASFEDSRHKLEYDLYYAKNYSPFLDLLIVLQTLRVVLWREGAR